MRLSLLYLAPTLVSLALAVPALAQKPERPGDDARSAFFGGAAWREFLDDADGEWRVEWNVATGTPRAIYGTGVTLADWRENSLAEARRHAGQLLEERRQLLGLGDSTLRESVGARMGRTWSFTFDQYYRDLPVIDGRVDVRVNSSGRIAMFGSRAWQLPADFNTMPSMTAEVATLIAWQALGETPVDVQQPGRAAAPRLVIWGDAHATTPQTPVLAWEVQVRNVGVDGTGKLGRCYIDASSGAMLRFVEGRHHCDAGCVHGDPSRAAADAALPTQTILEFRAWVQEGIDAYDPLVDRRMAGLVITVPNVGSFTTNANGRISIDIAAPVTITVTPLDGRHHDPITGASMPSATFTVTPGVFQQLYLGSANQTPAETAHCNSALWTDRVNEYVRRVLLIPPQAPFLDDLGITVNQAQTCNAYYYDNSINFYQAGGGCSNSAFPSVILHEWGHALDDHFGGFGSFSNTDGIIEGWADVVAMYVLDAPQTGSSLVSPGSVPRDGNNTLQFPNGANDHERGKSYMGFAWKLRDRLAQTLGDRAAAIDLTEQIVISTCVANAHTQPAAVLEIFLADDDDGDLNNGTPHAPELIWACQQHSLPYPAPTGVANDECSYAFELRPGVNGPFTTIGASTSSPAWSCTAGTDDVWFRLPISAAGTLELKTCGHALFDTTIELFTGSCGNLQLVGCVDDSCSTLRSQLISPVQPGVYYARVGGYQGATGTFDLEVNGPLGQWATSSSFGDPCGSNASGFHEMFPAVVPFDLAQSSLVMVNQGSKYLVQAGGSFVPPSAAATMLALTDDSEVAVALNGAFPHPGGSASTLHVCSNGYVSADTGNSSLAWVTPSTWYEASAPRWGSWQDFDPSPANGQVSFEQVGPIAYVTWNAVKLWNKVDRNTMQLQFDLTNGNVTLAWQDMVTGDGAVVGYASAISATVQPNTDISAALPGTFVVETLLFSTIASTLPRIGSTLTITTSFTAPYPLGLQVLGFARYPFGVSLDTAGMPGCKLYGSPDLIYVVLPSGNQMNWSLPLPFQGTLVGTELTAQSASFSPVNPAGLITSAGLALRIGL